MTTANTSDRIDLMDQISVLSKKLHALLCNTYGNCGESFRSLNDDLQDVYMWACADLAGELEKAATELGSNDEVKA